MRKLVFANAKGGVGKTTSCVNVAAYLALSGYRTLVVDMDGQGHVAKSLGVTDTVPGIAELMQREASLKEVQTPAREHLWVVAGSRRMAEVDQLISNRRMRPEMALAEAMEGLQGYDFVLLDTAPSWGNVNINCLFFADHVLVPVSMEVLSLQGLVDFVGSVRDVQHYREELELAGIIPTYYDNRVKKSSEVLAQLERYFEGLVMPPIRYNVRLSEAPGFGKHIFEHSRSSNGALDYAALGERVLRALGAASETVPPTDSGEARSDGRGLAGGDPAHKEA